MSLNNSIKKYCLSANFYPTNPYGNYPDKKERV